MSDLLDRLAELDLAAAGPGDGVLPPLTLSADLRNSSYKLAPIDVNLFPAGWHNLCPGNLPVASAALSDWLARRGGDVRRVILLGEAMTRNAPYIQNLCTIRTVLVEAGLEVRMAVPREDIPPEGLTVTDMDGNEVVLHGLRRRGAAVETTDGFAPDWIFSAHDFTDGVPDLIADTSVPIDPAPGHGWHARRKREFYAEYTAVARRAAEQLGLDPWTLIPATRAVEPVDFWNKEGVGAVADVVEEMLDQIADAYRERGIQDRPFVVIKDEAGTFGMGVISTDDPDAVRDPNRKMRQKMQRGKGGRAITSVLIQEGIYTRDIIRDCVAEPVMMAAGGRSIGGFFRYHCSRGETEVLNTKGMVFAKLCGPKPSRNCPNCVDDPVRRKVYGWLVEHVAAAAGLELATRQAG